MAAYTRCTHCACPGLVGMCLLAIMGKTRGKVLTCQWVHCVYPGLMGKCLLANGCTVCVQDSWESAYLPMGALTRGKVLTHHLGLTRGNVLTHHLGKTRGKVLTHQLGKTRGNVLTHHLGLTRGNVLTYHLGKTRGKVPTCQWVHCDSWE
ncbi:hypothetical protein EDB92DRAFT_1815680 [Lactarius akahatsu]|uniref:Secreted protein n=1 Tax=Lactarius akahatsu TaxID=416441 RepID=A0AAD4LKU4_9AGAM|nr:hypothetical protein EDB92DRAFT_1815680 [Lactarius akahatsu]